MRAVSMQGGLGSKPNLKLGARKVLCLFALVIYSALMGIGKIVKPNISRALRSAIFRTVSTLTLATMLSACSGTENARTLNVSGGGAALAGAANAGAASGETATGSPSGGGPTSGTGGASPQGGAASTAGNTAQGGAALGGSGAAVAMGGAAGGSQQGGTAGDSSQGGSVPQGGAGGNVPSGGNGGTFGEGGTAGSLAEGGAGGTIAQGGSGGTVAEGGSGGTVAEGGSGGTRPVVNGDFGNDTPGGRGGAVIRVTTLDFTGPGSISAALSASGPRIVVFEVGGVIDLNKARLDIKEPFVTLAGQTAPSPGITLIRGGMRILTHDVRIEHLRFRMGDAGDSSSTGFEPDVTTSGPEAHDVLFNHVSVAWAVDENLSVSGPRFDGTKGTSHKITIRDSIIAEGLDDSVHVKGPHSMGTLIHDYCTDVAVVRNLYAHNNERNPWFKGFATGAIVNNVVYNPGKWAMRLGSVNKEWDGSGITPKGPKVDIVGNVMHHGPNTPSGKAMVDSNSNGAAFLQDNVVKGGASPVSANIEKLSGPAKLPDWVDVLPSGSVVDYVVAHAGARPTDRDSVDARIIADFLAGRGKHIDSQNQVGGYPKPAPTTRALDVPSNVDAWLESLSAVLEGR